jgi:hypothetical protein
MTVAVARSWFGSIVVPGLDPSIRATTAGSSRKADVVGRETAGHGAMTGFPRASKPFVAAALALIIAPAGAARAATISEPVALLEGLDKTTARVSEFLAPVGKPVEFGTLSIVVRDCEKNPPEDTPENAAFVQIYEVRKGEEKARLFSGWMFSSSPALSALEHPVYDITVLDCRAASAASPSPAPQPAPPSTGGKTGR